MESSSEQRLTDKVPLRRRSSQPVKDDARTSEESVSLYEALGNETVTLNVGGVVFKTYYRTLARWPGTRLFSIAYQHAVSPDIKTPELFFDNDPTVFSSVLDYYRRGQLHF